MKLAVITTALAVLWAFPAGASISCASPEKMRAILTEKHGERQYIGGLSGFGDVLEFWGDESDGSWTVVKRRPDGMACIVDHGKNFFLLGSPAEGDPA